MTASMTTLTQQDWQESWYDLEVYKSLMAKQRIDALFQEHPGRAQAFSLAAAGLKLDFSKNLMTEEGLVLLLKLAQASRLGDMIEALFSGAEINNTEHRPALHTALRSDGDGLDKTAAEEVRKTFARMRVFVDKLHQKQWLGYSGKAITDVVNIGIGGSDLGPVMATRALAPYAQDSINVHFISNIDGTHVTEILKPLNPETTLFIVASKSFNTIETRMNAEAARDWCFRAGMAQGDIKHHFVAVSTNIAAVVAFGIDEENIFPMWDWVGGRYSLWSAIGLPIAISIGMDNFEQLLAGARAMDEHFRNADFRQNMPVIMGLLSVWYTNFMGAEAQAVIPYDHYLHKFPSFLQQLEMESNGKSVRRNGEPLKYHTKGVIFGEAGSNTQHSFHQLLHQGTHCIPVDFIVPAVSHNPVAQQHDYLFANCMGQSRALMVGRSLEQVTAELQEKGLDAEEIKQLAPHKVIPGNKPSNTIIMEKLTPYTLGALIALYEHKVFVESVIWGIDAFDQWGVELGKVLAEDIYTAMQDDKAGEELDESTLGLIQFFKEKQA